MRYLRFVPKRDSKFFRVFERDTLGVALTQSEQVLVVVHMTRGCKSRQRIWDWSLLGGLLHFLSHVTLLKQLVLVIDGRRVPWFLN